jgi:hypothetical protein
MMPESTETPQLLSTIKCPRCGGAREERMPTDSCVFFYECSHCGEILRPLPGDCCVFCSYGTVVCPSKQINPDELPCCQPREP